MSGHDWSADVFAAMRARDIGTVATIPDGGLTTLLQSCEASPDVNVVTLTTEEEGIGIATGLWLGGQKAMIAMQSSGVGNCINALGLPGIMRAPCLMLVTMRGQWGEFNPWQVAMGQGTKPVFPGETLLVEMWREKGTNDVIYQTKVKERDTVVLKGGV